MSEQTLHGLSKISTVLRHEAWAGAGPEGITPTQAQTLTLLNAQKQDVRVSDVAAHLAITAATASDAIRTLEEKGLLRRRASKSDGRIVLLKLTTRGRAVARRVAQWPDFLIAATDALTDHEAAVFNVALTKMIRLLQEQGRIPIARMCASCRYFQPNAYPGATEPHHCHYVDAAFGNRALRIDCDDFEEADGERRTKAWNEFLHSGPFPDRAGAGAQLVQIHQQENTR